MNKYRIIYSDCGESFVWACSAEDSEDAIERFWDSFNQDDAGIEIIKIEKIILPRVKK